MAFDRTNFGLKDPTQNSNLPRDWVYTTVDLATTVDGAGYFNDAKDLVNVGDVIRANIDTDGTPAYGEFYVSANDGTTVDVNNVVSIVTTTDSD